MSTRGYLDRIQVDASEEPERNELLRQALLIGDTRMDNSKGPVQVVSEPSHAY